MKTTTSKIFLSVAASALFVARACAVADTSEGEFAPRDPQPGWSFIVAPKLTLSISEQINLYAFVGNNPINKFDPLGLSAEDVTRIQESSRSYINTMTASGLRTGNGTMGAVWNNLTTPFTKRVGCAKQSDLVLGNALLPLKFDDTWTFAHVRTVFPLTHQYIIALSDNPKDPMIIIDPNHNEIRLLTQPTTTSRVLIGADLYRKSNNGSIQSGQVTFGDAVKAFIGPPPPSPFR